MSGGPGADSASDAAVPDADTDPEQDVTASSPYRPFPPHPRADPADPAARVGPAQPTGPAQPAGPAQPENAGAPAAGRQSGRPARPADRPGPAEGPERAAPGGPILVAVVGSANLDLTAYAPRRPAPGETVLGTGYEEHPGGKGLNQALAAASQAPAAFVGRRGADDAGAGLRAALAARGVDVAHFAPGDGPSGRALITVTPDAENSITVLPGANALLTADEVTAALDALNPAAVLVQQEIPAAAIAAAAAWAAGRGVRFALNASPAGPLPKWVTAVADPVLVNRAEAASLSGEHDPEAAVLALSARARSAVVTLGADGCLLARDGVLHRLTAPAVVPVDTTGAGDVFAGVLVARLALGDTPRQAGARAAQAAAEAIRVPRAER